MAASETIFDIEPIEQPAEFSLNAYLATDNARDLLRFSTAGSVDDGKSTLIGRLLYDTRSVYDDQVQSIRGKGTTAPGVLDLALLTDGLRAEREQGITIDVAYRYFSTERRKFIIADTPGHEQYTRNMATGASTADLAIVLIDARKGVITQSRRHAYITALLGVPQIIVAVNKMDLVGYDEQVFEAIRADFDAFFHSLNELRPPHIHYVPVSALAGENVVHRATQMPWYGGLSLLELLESVPTADRNSTSAFRLPVQRVLRPDHTFRGFAGQIAAGAIHPGDRIMVLPSRRTSTVRSIVTFDGDLPEATAPQSVTLTLDDELDISRGDLIVTPDSPAELTTHFAASLVWMDDTPLDRSRRYLLKHASRTVHAHIRRVHHRVDVATLDRNSADALGINDIGTVELESSLPLAVDRYTANRITGSFVLIDPITNATVAAGMIREPQLITDTGTNPDAPITTDERTARWRHTGAHIHLTGPAQLAISLERALFLRGAFVTRPKAASPSTIEALTSAGALVITHAEDDALTIATTSANITPQASQQVETIDDILRLLSARSILKGEQL